MAVLTLRIDKKILNTYELDPGKELNIGRSAKNDIIIDSRAVSARHAAITADNTGFIIKDMESRNGTYVAGKRVKACRLSDGDVVTLGRHELVFIDQQASPVSKADSPGEVTTMLDELEQLTLESTDKKDEDIVETPKVDHDKEPLLVVKFKNKVLYKYLLKDEKTEIGRTAKNKIIIDNQAVSSKHALVLKDGDGFIIQDLDSKNGTFVNEKKISRHNLQDGDVIAVGRHELIFESDGKYSKSELFQPSADSAFDAETTAVLDTRKYKDMLHKSKGEMTSGKAALVYLNGGSGEVPIKKNVLTIGKAEECDIVAKGFLVGETAALVLVRPDGYHLKYNKGVTKPTVNGVKIDKTIKLYDGDVIKVGSVTLRFGL